MSSNQYTILTHRWTIPPKSNWTIQAAAVRKLGSFRHLPAGWHYGDGGPIEQRILDAAGDVLAKLALSGFEHTDTFPGACGEVMVTAYENDHYLEIIVETDCSFGLVYEVDGQEELAEERMSQEAAFKKIDEIVGVIWNTCVFYTPSISTLNKTASKAWLSGTPQTPAAAQWLRWTVLTPVGDQFANMLDTSTHPQLRASHPFFGSLKKTSFRYDLV